MRVGGGTGDAAWILNIKNGVIVHVQLCMCLCLCLCEGALYAGRWWYWRVEMLFGLSTSTRGVCPFVHVMMCNCACVSASVCRETCPSLCEFASRLIKSSNKSFSFVRSHHLCLAKLDGWFEDGDDRPRIWRRRHLRHRVQGKSVLLLHVCGLNSFMNSWIIE